MNLFKDDEIQLENTNQTRMNTEQLDMLYRQQIIDMIQDRVNMRNDQTRVIPLRRGALIIYGDNLVDEDDYDSSYTEEEDTEDEGDDIDCETSEDDSMTVEDEEEKTEVYSDPSDFEWLVDLMVQGQKEDEENTKDIKSVERVEKKPKKLAKMN